MVEASGQIEQSGGIKAPNGASSDTLKVGPFPQYPEGSDMLGIRPILEAKGALSRRSRIRIKNPDSDAGGFTRESNRPDALRRTRRELMERLGQLLPVMKISKIDQNGQEAEAGIRQSNDFVREKRKELITEGHARDALAEEFINNQQEVGVNLGDLGEQMARFVILTPPEGRKTEETDSKPPIFLIPGISNDLESMGMLPQELAFSGRNVVTIGYPESWRGNVTDAFGEAARSSSGYEPHTSFFKGAIRDILQRPDVKEKLGSSAEIDLWGFSAGAAIVADILKDKKFQDITANARIIAPPSCVDQKNVKIFNQEIPLPKDMLYELWQIFRPRNLKAAAKLNVSNRGEIEYTEEKRKRMTKAYNALRDKVLKRNEWWKNDMRVKEGGSIIVVSYDNDTLTKSYKTVGEISQNPNLRVLELPGSHVTPRTEPGILIDAISKITNPSVTAAA